MSRARAIPNRRLTPAEITVGAHIDCDDELQADLAARPRVRSDCAAGSRPCPWVACRYHLYVHINHNGSLLLPYPNQEPWEIEHTCALDVAAQGGHTLEDVGKVIGVTRERVRQISNIAIDKIGGALDGFRD